MAERVKKIMLWRRDVDDRAGSLARVLEPLAGGGTSLQVVMGYRYPGQGGRAAIEVSPVVGRKATAAAQGAGLAPAPIPTLLVQGDDQPGLGHALAEAMAAAGINLNFLVAQVVDGRYSAIFGFDSDTDADRASGLIKKAASATRKATRKKAAARRRPAAGRARKSAGRRTTRRKR
jgi:predicted amino acid-binding ACT domain protein